MNYLIFVRPLIGAFTGYITNWVAVKMMFRPLNPIKIGNFKLPFTPGLIPKNKPFLAKSIGDTISNELLNEETLKNSLLSTEIKNNIENQIDIFINNSKFDNTTLEEAISSLINSENYNQMLSLINEKISLSIFQTVVNANLGTIIADQIEIAAKEKLKGSVFGIFGGNSLISSLKDNISNQLNDYIQNNGQVIISGMVENELIKYSNTTIAEIFENFSSNIDIKHIILKLYENIVISKISQILSTLNISNIVSEKINEMDCLELEKLILNIMKKELNALVNLGAIIGFLLGLINLLF